jgi:hypothetical protein
MGRPRRRKMVLLGPGGSFRFLFDGFEGRMLWIWAMSHFGLSCDGGLFFLVGHMEHQCHIAIESSLLVSFILIINFPVLKDQELPSILTHDLLPDILDTIEHRIVKGKIHRGRWEPHNMIASICGQ